jgi:predicted dehydrogenase
MTKPSANKLRIGVIGVGIGQAHISAYQKVPEVEIVALCDVNETRAQTVAQNMELQDAQVFTDHRAMLDEARLDAVSVGLPNFLHRSVAVDCLNAGVHVLCEKPLALNAKEGQKIADAAVKNNRICMVGQVNRFRDDSRFLKSAIENGELGRTYYSHTGWLRKRGIPGYGGWFTTKELSGGGPLIDIGVHLLDIAWWLCGCPNPVSVTGVTYAEFGPQGKGVGNYGEDKKTEGTFDVEDLAVALIRFSNGLTINLEVSWALHNEKTRQWCQIYGTEGGCDWGEAPAFYKEMDGVSMNTALDIGMGDPWRGQIQHFVDCILESKTPDPDVTQGVQMMKMLDAIYKSAATGREVRIAN